MYIINNLPYVIITETNIIENRRMMIDKKELVSVIAKRASVRNYTTSENENELLEKIEKFIAEINRTKGPFGNNITINLVKKNEDSQKMKLGTYGVIKGAQNFLVVTVNKAPNIMLDLGYLFEQVILYATSIGLATVWMAGTFSRNHFSKAINLTEGVMMPIVAPIGIETSTKSLISKHIIKSKSHVRNDFSTMFFEENQNKPLVNEQDSEFIQALENIRLAPSALNKQPWRVIKENNKFHFYKTRSSELVDIDLGIALCHFDLSMQVQGFNGSIAKEENSLMTNYVATWKLEK